MKEALLRDAIGREHTSAPWLRSMMGAAMASAMVMYVTGCLQGACSGYACTSCVDHAPRPHMRTTALDAAQDSRSTQRSTHREAAVQSVF
jgi:hypothetical protein